MALYNGNVWTVFINSVIFFEKEKFTNEVVTKHDLYVWKIKKDISSFWEENIL